jgi:hypothetical protein
MHYQVYYIARYCRCGKDNKKRKETYITCEDVEGQRRTKCPCFAQEEGCKINRKCLNCGNKFGIKTNASPKRTRKEKVTSSPSSLKRKRGYTFLSESGFQVEQGGWTLLETCILDTTESFLYSTHIIPNEGNIHELYNYVVKTKILNEMKITVNTKSINQIRGKLRHRQENQDAIKRIYYGINYLEQE